MMNGNFEAWDAVDVRMDVWEEIFRRKSLDLRWCLEKGGFGRPVFG